MDETLIRKYRLPFAFIILPSIILPSASALSVSFRVSSVAN